MKSGIIVINPIALSATKYIYNEKKRELCGKFSLSFMRHAEKLCGDGEDMSPYGKAASTCLPALAGEGGDLLISYLREMGEGGILNALWYMNEELGSGMEIDLRKIPIRQETVEILELFNVNPYYAESEGAWLLVTQDPVSVTEICRKAGLPCALIGYLTSGPARIIKNGDSVRYLDRPQEDALNVLRM